MGAACSKPSGFGVGAASWDVLGGEVCWGGGTLSFYRARLAYGPLFKCKYLSVTLEGPWMPHAV